MGLFFLGFAVPGFADPTSEQPLLVAALIYPYSVEGGQGFLFKVFQELGRRAGAAEAILQIPLTRALEEAKAKPVLLVPLGRSAERELFLNYGPVIYEDSLEFVARSGETGRLGSIDEAKGLSVATHQGSTTVTFLQNNGFKKLSTAPDNTNLLRMLLAKRVDLIYLADGILRAVSKDKEFAGTQFDVVLVVSKYPLYLAASKSVAPAVLQRWGQALEDMKADGTYAKLTRDYMAPGSSEANRP